MEGPVLPTGPFPYPAKQSPGKEKEFPSPAEKEVIAVEKPLLSIGMIVKNEIRCIEECLKALQPLREAIPCQLVIADTGSDDGTREVAERYADLLFDFEWINDFAAARNAVLDRCAGKWALIVDADEYLVSGVPSLVDFLTGSGGDQYVWGCVDILSYADTQMIGDEADSLGLRLARMDRHPRYVGVIHEAFPDVRMDEMIVLLDVKFAHDGYARDPRHPEHYIQKMERNLALLDQELEENPQDLRRLLQCVESSSPFPSRMIDYIRRAMDVLYQSKDTIKDEMFAPILCRYALKIAALQQMPELEAWSQWSAEHYGDSLFLRLDGSFTLLKYYMDQKNYQKVPQYATDFVRAWRDFRDQNFNLTVLMFSTLGCTARKFEVYARTAGAQALAHLGRTGEAAALLEEEPDWDGLKPAELAVFLNGCVWAAAEESLQEFVASGAEAVRAMTGEDAAGMWDAFCVAAKAAFQKRGPDEDAPERPWLLFAKVSGGLGQAVRLMEGGLAEIQAVLPRVQAEDWPDIPAPAVVRAVDQGAGLPDAFFSQSRERLAELAAAISGGLTTVDLLDWTDRWDFTASMTRFQFVFYLLSSALQADKTWEEEGGEREALLDRFLDVAADYLPNYYNPELLSDEAEWMALPGLHRFALHMLKGRAAREGGDELGYVRALRAALKADPTMKKAVSHLRGSLSAAPESELVALAEQVTAILAQYPADAPEVMALKASPAYQRVAGLLDGAVPPTSSQRHT